MRGLTVWRGNPRPCFDRYYYKNLPTKPAFSNLPRPLPPSPPRELDHPALNPNLCPTDSSGDADSDFSDPMKRTSGSVPTGTPPDPPISACGGTDSSLAYQAELEAPPHSRPFIGFGARPPECRLQIGRLGRHSGRAAGVATPLTSGRWVAQKGPVIATQKEGGRLC